MKRPSRASLVVLASASLAIGAGVAGLALFGPFRSVRLAECALDRALHGATRDLDGVVVELPASWCELERNRPRGTSELRAARVAHSRSSRGALAIVRRVDFELSSEAIERALPELGFETPEYGSWLASDYTDVELGGRPGYEIRFARAVPGGAATDEVAADFMVPELHLWVQCAPMSPADLANCRALAASATAP